MKAQAVAIDSGAADVYFCWLGDTAQREARRLAEQLRDADPHLRLVLHAGGGKLAAQLKRADRSGAQFALVLGDAEIEAGTVQVKSLRGEAGASAAQLILPRSEEHTSELQSLMRISYAVFC